MSTEEPTTFKYIVGERPIFTTGNERWDGFLTVSIFLITCYFIVDIGNSLRRAWQANVRSFRDARAKCDVLIFLVLAVVSFVVVNRIRGETQDVLYNVKFEDNTPQQNIQYAKDKAVDTVTRPIKYVWNVAHHLFDKVDKDYVPAVVYDKMEEALKNNHEYDFVDSLWSCFKMTVATYSRFWWTQQWFMGYLAWSLFVGIQGRNRRLSSSNIFSFIFIGYASGLAGTQCLFYALLRMKPPSSTQSAYSPDRATAQFWTGIQALLIALFPLLLADERAFNFKDLLLWAVQLSFVLGPAVLHSDLFFRGGPLGYLARRCSAPAVKRAVVWLWWTMSFTAFILHVHAWYMAVSEAHSGKYESLYQQGKDVVQGTNEDIDLFWRTINYLLHALRLWNHWVSALAYDVVLSAFSLCVWTVVANVNAWKMTKCGLYPWLDETHAAVGQAVNRVGEFTGDIYDKIADSQPLAKARDAWSSAKEEARRRRASAMHRFVDDDEEEDDDDEDEEDDYGRPTRAGRPRGGRRASVGAAASRSRSRAASSSVKRNPSRRSSRARTTSMSRRASEVGEEVRKKILAPTAEAVKVHSEAAGMGIGLLLVGGLGVGSAAVFGAED